MEITFLTFFILIELFFFLDQSNSFIVLGLPFFICLELFNLLKILKLTFAVFTFYGC
jgi:hypothetical protein